MFSSFFCGKQPFKQYDKLIKKIQIVNVTLLY